MMPAAKCVTAMPEDKLSSVVTSLVNEKIGCVVVVDPAAERAVGIVTKQDVNRMFLNQVRTGFVVVTDTERLRRDAAAPRGFRGGASRPTVPSRPRPRPRRPRPRARTKASARRVRGERKKTSVSSPDDFFPFAPDPRRRFHASRVLTLHAQTPLETPVKDVMSTTLYPAAPEMSRDEAAEILQKRKIHHAVVQNVSGKFAGLLSSWDIARECSLDAKVINVRDVQWVTHKR
jgi:CBS domain-containing protein